MTIDGIVRVEAVESQVHNEPKGMAPAERCKGKVPQGDQKVPGSGAGAAELHIGFRRRGPGASLPSTYAKIRVDKDTNSVLIQIIDSDSGDVIREIPPGAWAKLEANVLFPKGLLVEREQ